MDLIHQPVLIVTFLHLIMMCAVESNVHPKIKLLSNYSIHEAPIRKDGVPIDVNFTINLRNILEVNEVSQLISIETSIRMFWKDYRVQPELENGKEIVNIKVSFGSKSVSS